MFVVNGKGSITQFISGTLILCSIVLSFIISPKWMIVTSVLGFGLVISSLTGFSIMEKMLVSIGVEKRKVTK